MASEKTHAEARFKNESMSSGTDSDSPEDPKEKTISHKSNPGIPKLLLASLLILFLLKAVLSSVPSIILYEKYSQHLEEKMTVKGLVHTELGVCKKQFDHTK